MRLRLPLLLLTGLLALADHGSATGTPLSPLDPLFQPGMPLDAAIAAARARGLEVGEPQPLPPDGQASLVVAVPAGDDCSPRGAFLLCDGLRLQAEAGSLALVETYAALPTPRPAAALLREATARFGRPAATERLVDRQRGRELQLLRYRWHLRQGGVPQRITLTLVLQEHAVLPAASRAATAEPQAAGIGLSLQRLR